MPGEAFHQDLDADLILAPADDEPLADIRQRTNHLQQIETELAQLMILDILGPEREGDDRDVIHTDRLDQRHLHVRRHTVHVGLELVVDLHDRGAHLLADLEAHGHHRRPALSGRVDMPNALDLLHDPFERIGHQTLDLLRGGARILHEDVDHRDRDLRVLLARREQQTQDPEEERAEQEHRRDRRIDEGAGNATGEAEG